MRYGYRLTHPTIIYQKLSNHPRDTKTPLSYDPILIFSSLTLLLLGLVMVTSASINIAYAQFNDPLHYFWRQFTYAGIGIGSATVIIRIPIYKWQRLNRLFLLSGFIGLVLVIVPGIGHEVNGSMRWIMLGFVRFQPSELMKYFFSFLNFIVVWFFICYNNSTKWN